VGRVDALVAFIGSTTAVVVALTGLMSAIALLVARIEALRSQLNGRLDNLVTEARVAGHAEGVLLAQELNAHLHPTAAAPVDAPSSAPSAPAAADQPSPIGRPTLP
jgi:hypothetical protein